MASFWNEDDWVTEGGKRKINWNPFPCHVSFKGLDIQGCMYEENTLYCAHIDSHPSLGSWSYYTSHKMSLHQENYLSMREKFMLLIAIVMTRSSFKKLLQNSLKMDSECRFWI